jgi:aconitate decarboxylase
MSLRASHELTAAGKLAKWACDFSFEDLTPEGVGRIKSSIRDGLGCGIFGSTMPTSGIMCEAVLGENPTNGRTNIWGTSRLASPLEAALINGAAVQAFELDDMLVGRAVHGSSVLLPTVLAIAGLHKVTGKEMIRAEAIGLEIGGRFAPCLTKNLLNAGWHSASIFGTITAAAASGAALRLDIDQLTNCILLGVLQASGLLAVQYDGMAKRFYAGRSAHSGLLAALLAQKGFEAPKEAIEHSAGGFFSTFAQGSGYNIEKLSDNLGGQFTGEHMGFKIYSCCGAAQPGLDAMSKILKQHPEVTRSMIREVTVFLSEPAFMHCGWDYIPKDVTTAQFNMQYSMAIFILQGQAFIDQYQSYLIADPSVLEMVKLVKVVNDPEMTAFSKQGHHHS